jgi:hypothetical protein
VKRNRVRAGPDPVVAVGAAILCYVAWSADPRAFATGVPTLPPLAAEQHYRIEGRIRIGFVWVRRESAGSARVTWRTDDHESMIALFAGADPDRVPRRLNQWLYVHEEVRSAGSRVLMVRSEADASKTPRADAPLALGCASISDGEAHTRSTRIHSGVTYRTFDQWLGRLSTDEAAWDEGRRVMSADAEPGLLTALRRVILGNLGGAPAAAAPVSYLFNGNSYEMTVRGVKSLGRSVVNGRTYDQLARSDLAIRDLTTGDVTRFAVTHDSIASASGLPVQVFFQPSFWVRIELTADDTADVPPDPAGNRDLRVFMRRTCGSAAGA